MNNPQKVFSETVTRNGDTTEYVVIAARDARYPNILQEVRLTVEDAMELSRLLADKLGEIPA